VRPEKTCREGPGGKGAVSLKEKELLERFPSRLGGVSSLKAGKSKVKATSLSFSWKKRGGKREVLLRGKAGEFF